MCYEFERWNWKSRVKQREAKSVATQSSAPAPQVPKPVQTNEPARKVKVEEKAPA